MIMLQLYNTLTRKKEIFKPLKNKTVKFYHCGPTVYWTQHIGNLRGMFCGDMVARVLKYNDYKVKHVRNYTDVGHLASDEDGGEDKMEQGAKREHATPAEIAAKYIKIFEHDTKELNLSEPDVKPRATEVIPEIIAMVKTLMTKGYAYAADLAIYFDTSKAKNYGRLSGQKREDKAAGAGGGEVSDSRKKHPADFALWFFKAGAHKNAMQYWPSPFHTKLVDNGYGFPGWHIECSAMIKKFLGPTIDIHMGGVEHIPVHHTNEIAQSEAANGVKFVNYWLHNEHLLVNRAKMAKSQGTGFSLEEIKRHGLNPLVLRYFFLQAHYRSKENFTWPALAAAKNGLEHLYNQTKELAPDFLAVYDSAASQTKKAEIAREWADLAGRGRNFKAKFLETVNDDLNTAKALAAVQEMLKSNLSAKEKMALLLDFDQVLGLNIAEAMRQTPAPERIKKLMILRDKARQAKNWTEADRLRREMEGLGYEAEDTREGQRVKKSNLKMQKSK